MISFLTCQYDFDGYKLWTAMENRVVKLVTSKPPFKAIGGWLCLDFVDSVNWDTETREAERFFGYADLVRWGQFAKTLTSDEAKQLFQEAIRRPEEAAVIYNQALDLRATLHRIFSAIAGGASPEETDLAALNAALSNVLANACLVPTEDGFAWAWGGEDAALGRVLWPIVRSTAELLTSDKLDRVGQCAGDSCGWLFLDTSRNRSRRWCEMEHCGNRAKARRHYRRQQAENR
jgi:predicted RNA-binding Zn ribbon-like protein